MHLSSRVISGESSGSIAPSWVVMVCTIQSASLGSCELLLCLSVFNVEFYNLGRDSLCDSLFVVL